MVFIKDKKGIGPLLAIVLIIGIIAGGVYIGGKIWGYLQEKSEGGPIEGHTLSCESGMARCINGHEKFIQYCTEMPDGSWGFDNRNIGPKGMDFTARNGTARCPLNQFCVDLEGDWEAVCQITGKVDNSFTNIDGTLDVDKCLAQGGSAKGAECNPLGILIEGDGRDAPCCDENTRCDIKILAGVIFGGKEAYVCDEYDTTTPPVEPSKLRFLCIQNNNGTFVGENEFNLVEKYFPVGLGGVGTEKSNCRYKRNPEMGQWLLFIIGALLVFIITYGEKKGKKNKIKKLISGLNLPKEANSWGFIIGLIVGGIGLLLVYMQYSGMI